MTIRNVALIAAGKVENVIVVEDDPAQWPGYVRACNPPDVDVLAQFAESHDAVVELHDGEMCEPGATLHPNAIELVGKVGVVRVVQLPDRAVEMDGGLYGSTAGASVTGPGGKTQSVGLQGPTPIAVSRFERAPVVVGAEPVKG